MPAATSAASESDLLMAEHTGRVQDPASANGDVWGMPGRVSSTERAHYYGLFLVPSCLYYLAKMSNLRFDDLPEIWRNLYQTFEDASNGGSGPGDGSLQGNDTSLANLVRFVTESGLLPLELSNVD